ncbi:helix-turn-helix transcriptional regulator [Anaeromyxobacter oryzisoli]|uniref:helix-turn-helix transcriptional regulator n=1 Tax=Anaeromyxobacter oryzisoli TaxID=2925408 RepID=UPI001F5A9286|nr:helix-turn-helix transcriptional regulator [Anaeromyxobacter sp. SG63]
MRPSSSPSRRAEKTSAERGPRVPGDEAADAGVFDRPPAHLARRIDLLWSASGDGAPGGPRGATTLHDFFPDAGVHLVFRRSPEGCRAVLLGPATERATIERATGAEYLGIRFLAGQAPRLADVRSSDLTDGLVEVTRLGGVPVEEVADRLSALPDVGSRRRALAELAGGQDRSLVEDVHCRRGALLLEARRGQLRVDQLAAELGLHARTLERRFRDQLGMTPKRLIRLVRLRHVLGALRSGAFGTLAELALACGYADQPHLIRDFKALTARLPRDEDACRSRLLARAETRVIHRHHS